MVFYSTDIKPHSQEAHQTSIVNRQCKSLLVICFLAFLLSVCLYPSCHRRQTYGPDSVKSIPRSQQVWCILIDGRINHSNRVFLVIFRGISGEIFRGCSVLDFLYRYSVNIPGFPPIFRGTPQFCSNIPRNINIPRKSRILQQGHTTKCVVSYNPCMIHR